MRIGRREYHMVHVGTVKYRRYGPRSWVRVQKGGIHAKVEKVLTEDARILEKQFSAIRQQVLKLGGVL